MTQVTEAKQPLNDRMHLSVITAREPVANNRWISERWRVVGVVAAGAVDRSGGERRTIYSGTDATHYLWSGFELRLYPHESESYYRNLLGQVPSVYVVCQVDESGELIPVETSADYIEAGARREAGDEVAPVPMPPEIYRWVEAFVVNHYTPEEPKLRRKRPDGHRSGGPRQYEPND
jgi:Protein of unknown function (DUF3305)